MNLLKNIKSFKLIIVIFCGTVVGVPTYNPPTYDYYQDKGDSFNYIGAKTFKDFIQTTSGKVLSQRERRDFCIGRISHLHYHL